MKRNEISLLNQVQSVAVADILSCNAMTARYGLRLNEEDAKALVQTRTQALYNSGRVEFAGSALPKIIIAFADSPYLADDSAMDTLHQLVEAFYEYKSETRDEVDDDELIALMRHHFDHSCQGSVEFLREDLLASLSRSVRFGEDIFAIDNNVDDDAYDQ